MKKLRLPNVPPKVIGWLVAIIVVISAIVTRETWIPATDAWVENSIARFGGGESAEGEKADEHSKEDAHD